MIIVVVGFEGNDEYMVFWFFFGMVMFVIYLLGLDVGDDGNVVVMVSIFGVELQLEQLVGMNDGYFVVFDVKMWYCGDLFVLQNCVMFFLYYQVVEYCCVLCMVDYECYVWVC